MAPEGFAKSEPPRFSPKLLADGMQRINDLFSAWHGKNQGRISVFPAAALTETPLGRIGSAEDVAHAVLFFVGPGAGHVTGQSLAVDGGQALGV